MSAPQEKISQAKLNQVWRYLQDASPANRKKLLDSLDEKTINALRTQKNPYKVPIIKGRKCRMLAFYHINFTEKYANRFAVTSFIGFIYRMLDEYKPPTDLLSEDDPKFANPYNELVRQTICDRPKQMLIERYAVVKAEIEKLIAGTDADKASLIKAKVKETFVLRAKLCKHQLYMLLEATDDIEKHYNAANRNMLNIKNDIQQVKNVIALYDSRITKKLAIMKASTESLSETVPSNETAPASAPTPKKTPEQLATELEETKLLVSKTLGEFEEEKAVKLKLLAKLESDLPKFIEEFDKLGEVGF